MKNNKQSLSASQLLDWNLIKKIDEETAKAKSHHYTLEEIEVEISSV